MKRIDRLVIGEMLIPWLFGVFMFTVLISAGQFLFQITEYLSKGADVWSTVKLLGLLMPGVMAKTFSMAVLLSALLSFGRLSGDSEIVAMRAGGISVARIMLPVGVFGLVVFGIAMSFNEYFVPRSTLQAIELRIELDAELEGRRDQATSRAIYEDGRLTMFLIAKDFNISSGTLTGVHLIVFGNDGEANMIFIADVMEFTSEQDWQVPGGGTLYDLKSHITVTSESDILPTSVPNPDVTPNDLLVQTLRDLDALSMKDMKTQIDREKKNPDYDKKKVANLEFGYWNKLALPLAALVFGLVGAPLGIRNHRAGTATGFALSIVIIFGYMMLANAMSIMAQGGRIPAFVASFTPIVIGLVVAIVLIQRRNR